MGLLCVRCSALSSLIFSLPKNPRIKQSCYGLSPDHFFSFLHHDLPKKPIATHRFSIQRASDSRSWQDDSSLALSSPYDRYRMNFPDPIPGRLGMAVVGLIFFSSAGQEENSLSEGELQELADYFKLGARSESMGNALLQQTCFEKAYQACCQGEWDKLPSSYTKLIDRWGRSLLIAAVDEGNQKLSEEMVRRKVALTYRDSQENNPLHIAAKNGFSDLVAILSESGYFKVDTPNKEGETPLLVAITYGHSHCVESLLRHGASYKMKKGHFNAIALSVRHGRYSCLQQLCDLEPKIKSQFNEEISEMGNILHLALLFRQTAFLEELVHDYPEEILPLLTREDPAGRLPLHLAAFLGDLKAVRLLADKIPRSEQRNSRGETAVHWAAKGEQSDVIRLLSYLDFELEKPDHEGVTPILLVKEKRNVEAQRCYALLSNLSAQVERAKANPPDLSQDPPKCLVFKGGGPNGIAHGGALKQLDALGLLDEVSHVAGSSAGAITAALLAVGFKTDRLLEIMLKMDFTTFLDPVDSLARSSKVRPLLDSLEEIVVSEDPPTQSRQLYRKFSELPSLYKGENLREWIDKLIEEATGIRYCTFGELKKLAQKNNKFKHLCVYAIQFQSDSPTALARFDSEDPKWKDLIISDAVCASATIPGLFKPRILHFKIGDRVVPREEYGSFVDPGLIKNFPLDAFDQNKQQGRGEWGASTNRRVLGFNLQGIGKIKVSDSLLGYIERLINVYYDAEEILQRADSSNNDRSITIPIERVWLFNFGLSKDEKQKLITAGEEAVKVRFPFSATQLMRRNNPVKSRYINIDGPINHFTGRVDQLQKLAKVFISPGQWEEPRAPVVVRLIWGLEGIGKTQLINQFANNNLNCFSIIWRFNYGDEKFLYEQYIKLANKLELSVESGISLASLKNKVHNRLSNDPNDKPWLLIFEDVEKPLSSSDLPKRGGCVAITSRHNNVWEFPSDHIHMHPLSEKEGVDLLKKITKEKESSEMRDLVTDLNGHPILLSAIAHHIAKVPGASVHRALLEKDAISDYTQKLKKIWQYSLAGLSSPEHAQALKLLKICAFLGGGVAIPFSWLKYWEKDLAKIDQILTTLKDFDIIRYERGDDFFSICSLWQRAIREEIPVPEKKQILSDIIGFFASHTQMNLISTEALKANQYFVPHIDPLLSQGRGDSFSDIIILLCHSGNYFLQKDRLLEARGRFESALKYCEDGPKQDIPNLCKRLRKQDNRLPAYYGKALHYIGVVHFRLGNLKEAEEFFNRSIEIRKEIDRRPGFYKDPDPIDSIIFRRQGPGWLLLEKDTVESLKEAEKLYLDLKGEDSDDFNQMYCNRQLAITYYQLAKISKERHYYEKSYQYLQPTLEQIRLNKIAKKADYYLLQSKLCSDRQSPHYNLEQAEEASKRVIEMSESMLHHRAKAYYRLAKVNFHRYQETGNIGALSIGLKQIENSLELSQKEKEQFEGSPLKIDQGMQKAQVLQDKIQKAKDAAVSRIPPLHLL